MNAFVLRELLLLSHIDRGGRRILFDPSMTVIQGRNDTGKSSVLKSIFAALGAEPATVHPRWREAKVMSLLRFDLGDKSYSMLRAGGMYSLFESESLIGTFESVSKDLAPVFSRLFGSELRLTDRNGEQRIAPPAYHLLPFYIDQDLGWSKTWSSFANLSQFQNWRRDVVYFHSGIRPNDWYRWKARLSEIERQLEGPTRKQGVVLEMLKSVERDLSQVDFSFDIDEFREELSVLLQAAERLHQKESEYRAVLAQLENDRQTLESQVAIVDGARRELSADYDFSVDLGNVSAECPTCGAVYENDLIERFSIARDEDRCLELAITLAEDLRLVRDKISEHETTLLGTQEELTAVRAALLTRQGALTLREIVEKEGTRQLAKRLREQRDALLHEISTLDAEQESARSRLRELEDKNQKVEIEEHYRRWMQRFLDELDVRTLEEKSYRSIDCVVKETGSDLPRAILAYTFSFLETMRSFGSVSRFPLVIDAPNQQEQDSTNLRRIIKFIVENSPEGGQIVLGLVDDAGVDLPGARVELIEKYRVLSQDDYEDIAQVFRPLLRQAV